MDITEYICDQCGADAESVTADCCDDCVLKFLFEDVHGPKFVWSKNV